MSSVIRIGSFVKGGVALTRNMYRWTDRVIALLYCNPKKLRLFGYKNQFYYKLTIFNMVLLQVKKTDYLYSFFAMSK